MKTTKKKSPFSLQKRWLGIGGEQKRIHGTSADAGEKREIYQSSRSGTYREEIIELAHQLLPTFLAIL
jgi:hypothetical protein